MSLNYTNVDLPPPGLTNFSRINTMRSVCNAACRNFVTYPYRSRRMAGPLPFRLLT